MAPITFQLVAPDQDYSSAMVSGCVNGGTVWMDNMAQALRWHGHKAELASINSHLTADYVIIQSEAMKYRAIGEYVENDNGKVICFLGHFNPAHRKYAHIDKIKSLSKYIFTPWEGPLLLGAEYPLIPHAYNDLADDCVSVDRRGSVVFAGNSYPLRHEGWIENLGVTRIYKTLPQYMPAIYRGADVCVNIHGDFQKNIVSCEMSRVSDKPGMMVNERFWSILGSGGLMVTDWVPQMARWFSEDELIVGHDRREFQELVKYYSTRKQEGLDKLQTARDKVRKMHTYKERTLEILKYLV